VNVDDINESRQHEQPATEERIVSFAIDGLSHTVVGDGDEDEELYDMGEDDTAAMLPQQRGDGARTDAGNVAAADLCDMCDASLDQELTVQALDSPCTEAATDDFGFELYDMGEDDGAADNHPVSLEQQERSEMETAHLSLNAAQQQRSAVDGDGELYENNSSQANDADSADLGTASTG
tara:strand:+ start:255 stop:791 length:537 start_codon:yes stop_codon:yes gene_type:complete